MWVPHPPFPEVGKCQPSPKPFFLPSLPLFLVFIYLFIYLFIIFFEQLISPTMSLPPPLQHARATEVLSVRMTNFLSHLAQDFPGSPDIEQIRCALPSAHRFDQRVLHSLLCCRCGCPNSETECAQL